MTTLSEKVTSVLKHPATGFLSGLYLTGVGITAIKYINKNRETTKNSVEKVVAICTLTGIIGSVTLLLGGRTAYKLIKND